MTIHQRKTIEEYKYGGPITVGVIPDTHWCPSDRKESLKVARALGKYYRAVQPDVVVHIGDANDMGSLSSYDKGKASAEGKRLKKELEFSRVCLDAFREALGPVEPDLYLTLGNHEERLFRFYNDEPAMADVLGPEPWGYEEAGWHVTGFLDMLCLNRVFFSHYFQNPNSVMGSPIGGTIENCLKNLGHSFVQGHVQTLRSGQMHRGNGDIHCGLVAGACYTSDHGYKGAQGNYHWRGTCLLSNVEDGYYDLSTMGLRSLLRDFK